MSRSVLKAKVLKEIDLVPDDKLPQLYDVIHYFRVGLEPSPAPPLTESSLSIFFRQSPLTEVELDLRRDDSPLRDDTSL